MSDIYSNPTSKTPSSNRFRTYFRLVLLVSIILGGLLLVGGTYVISLPQYSLYRMHQANSNSSYAELSNFINTQALATSLVNQKDLDFEALAIDRDELIFELASQLGTDIRQSTQDRTFFNNRYGSFLDYFNQSNITIQDGWATATVNTSLGPIQMRLQRQGLKWVWTEIGNPDQVDIDDLVAQLSDNPREIQQNNLEVIDLEGNLLAAGEIQITLNSYQITESLEAIPNSFSPSLPDKPNTRYLSINITAEFLGDGREVLLAISVLDQEDQEYQVYPGNAPIEDDISAETLISGVPITGNLLFEIDQESEPVYLQYGNFFETRYRVRLDSLDSEEEGEEPEESVEGETDDQN